MHTAVRQRQNTADRAQRFNGVPAEALYHPPRLAEQLTPGPYGDYILSVGRLEAVKRVDLAIRALALVPGPLRLVIAGIGTQRTNFEALAQSLGISDRVHFQGEVDDATLLGLYAEPARSYSLPMTRTSATSRSKRSSAARPWSPPPTPGAPTNLSWMA